MRDSTVDDAVQGLRSEFGEAGKAAAAAVEHWSSGALPFVHDATLAAFIERAPRELLLDCFWQTVPFGTGGRRGTVGVGPNRINQTIVGVTIQGHADFLLAQARGADVAVVVANDVRVFNDISGAMSFLGADENALLGASSRTFARLAAEIYAANGISVYFPDPHAPEAVLTTPELSYSVRELNAAGGINLSASHNPPDDNGIKIYDGNGAQFVAPWDDALNEAVANPSPVQWMEFEDALEQGSIAAIPSHVHDSYVALYTEEFDRTRGGLSARGRVVYTPLCGSGLSSTGEVLTAIGVDVLVPPGQGPDGSFASLPFRAPNPEVPQATDPARRFADAEGVGCVISTDPDADRIGVDVLHDGSWVHLSGNQIAAILGHFLLNDEDGPQRSGVVIETLVTTKLLREIAERSPGCKVVDDLLVGFKYVAEVLRSLEESGRYRDVSAAAVDLVLAAEESHGILTVPSIRDKDATSAAIYLAPLHSTLAERGSTLVDYFEHVLSVYGVFGETARSIVLRGNAGVRRMADLMTSVRRDPPAQIAGRAVRERLDYWDETAFGPFLSESDRLSRNVVQWKADGLIVTVRPSGTEPKLKLYVQTTPDYDAGGAGGSLMERATAAASLAAAQVYAEVLERMGHSLTEAAALLPDLVELDQKLAFDATIAPELVERLGRGETSEAIVWLRQVTQKMVPGADPLPALDATLQSLLRTGDIGVSEAFLELVRGELRTNAPTEGR